jgi:hypothetical protein
VTDQSSPGVCRSDCFDHGRRIRRRPTRAAHRTNPHHKQQKLVRSRRKSVIASLLRSILSLLIWRCWHRSRRQFISRCTCLPSPSARNFRIITSQTLLPLRRRPASALTTSPQLLTPMVAFLRCPIALTHPAVLRTNVQTLSLH